MVQSVRVRRCDTSPLSTGCESTDLLSCRRLSYGEVEILDMHSRRLLALERDSRLLGLVFRIIVEHSPRGFPIRQHRRVRSPHTTRRLDSPQNNSESERK